MPHTRNSDGKYFIFIASVVMFITAIAIIFVFMWLHSSAKENLIFQWKEESKNISGLVSEYMKTPVDAVEFSAISLEKMLDEDESHTAAESFVKKQTLTYAIAIKDNITGVYCYYRGHYLDGSGWVPPEGYSPKDRPWYRAALAAKGATVFTKPYRNLQTNVMMMSVSKLLSDNESVVSMDIFMDGVQRIIEHAAMSSTVHSILVYNADGYVIAHSDAEMVSRNIRELHGPDAELMQGFNTATLELRADDATYTAFIDTISEDWRVATVLDNSSLYKSMNTVYIASAAILLLILGCSIAFIARTARNHAAIASLSDEIAAVAEIYMTMVRINLVTDRIHVLRNNPDIDRLLAGNFSDYSRRAIGFAEQFSAEQSREVMKRFMDPATLADRLNGISSISQEFMDDLGRWMRLRFVVVNRLPDGSPHNILLAFESIDEDRKRQEKLRRLSETDLMTGVRNRGSGENMVRQAMAEGHAGMFCLLDADRFKSINDTFGHAAGDAVIKALARTLQSTFRDSDIVFRLGGDEFAAFAEGVVDEEIGKRIMERFFENIRKLDIPEIRGRELSVSVGATFYPATRKDSFEAMYLRADKATYVSKKIRDNRVTFNPDETGDE